MSDRARLIADLRSKRADLVAAAARRIRAEAIGGLEPELTAAFDRLIGGPVRADPGGQAALAVLEALDFAESMDAAPFLRAARHGPLAPVDGAAGVRARGVLGLGRIGHDDFALVVAHLATDPQPSVRVAALEALGHRGERGGAGLALMIVRRGDDEPGVTLAAMTALVALAPAWGHEALAAILAGERGPRRELAAVALGQSRTDAALTTLLEALAGCTRPPEREPLLRAIGLHRSDRALDAMIAIVADGGAADAAVAVAALGARRFEPRVAERVRAAAADHPRGELADAIARAFPP